MYLISLVLVVIVSTFCVTVTFSYPSIEYLTNTGVFLKWSNDSLSSTGSGFLVADVESGVKPALFLVTNAHILPPPNVHQIGMRRQAKSKSDSTMRIMWINIQVRDSNDKFLDDVAIHPLWDVAAINISRYVERIDSIVIGGSWMNSDWFMPQDSFERWDITEGDDVMFLGFPGGTYDSLNSAPIVRQGVLATNPTNDLFFQSNRYDLPSSIPGFLIDANVFPGSSGSLVVRRPDFSLMIQLGASLATMPLPLGILFGSIPDFDSAIGSLHRIGLGVVLRNEVILETIHIHRSRR